MREVRVKFLSAESILDLHEEILGGRSVISESLLESAVAAPRWYDRLHYQAAALFRSLTKNHAFVDGNKRTAVLATLTFLDINGYGLKAREETIYKFVMKVTVTTNPDIAWIAGWFRRHMVKNDEE